MSFAYCSSITPVTYDQMIAYAGKSKHRLVDGWWRWKLDNTRFRIDEATKDVVFKLYDTEIVKLHEGGEVSIRSGGWATPTTIKRIKNLTKLYASCAGGMAKYKGVNITDWTRIDKDGDVAGPVADQSSYEAADRKLRKLLSNYCRGWAKKACDAGKFEEPGPGDCWMCKMEMQSTGYIDIGHRVSHLVEPYFCPSFLVLALNREGMWWWLLNDDAKNKREAKLRRDLRMHFNRLLKPTWHRMVKMYERQLADPQCQELAHSG